MANRKAQNPPQVKLKQNKMLTLHKLHKIAANYLKSKFLFHFETKIYIHSLKIFYNFGKIYYIFSHCSIPKQTIQKKIKKEFSPGNIYTLSWCDFSSEGVINK